MDIKVENNQKKLLLLLKKNYMTRLIFLFIFLVLWESIYYLKFFPVTVFPSLETILNSLWDNMKNGELLYRTYYSLVFIFKGMLIGLGLAAVMTALAISSGVGRSFINSLIAVAHPLPGIALLPLLVLWFGLGGGSIIFIIVHSVLWPILLNTMSGFSSVPTIYKDFGMNIGLSRVGLIRGIYIPATLPNIYTGLKIGWARSWRALISAEMIFGATGSESGLGWYIYEKRAYSDVPGVFASLIIIVVIGVLVEDVIFNHIEKNTIRKWGMQS